MSAVPSAYRSIEIRRVSGALGAEITGVDLAKRLSEQQVAEIRRAWLENVVVFFRGQPLTPAQFMTLAERFGEPVEYPLVKGIEGFPRIIEVKKLEHERVNFGGIWHSDTTYLERPPMGSMLLARELPPFGGDTLFANMELAYESLSEGMKRMLAGLKAVNTSTKANASKTREDRLRSDGRESRSEFTAEHPIVRTHPETGRKALYVNPGHTVRISGLTEEESEPILSYLYQHQIRPEFTCRFVWQPGSIAFWDNRSAQHNPVNDYHGYRRLLHRITLAGDRPR